MTARHDTMRGVHDMKPSAQLYGLIREFEGKRMTAYDDGTGTWTIGYGHTRGVRPGDVLQHGEEERLLSEDVNEAVAAVRRHVTAPVTQGMFDGLTDFVFNLGEHNLQRSTLLKKLNALDYTGAASEFEKWDMAGQYHLRGLHRRRVAELMLFNN